MNSNVFLLGFLLLLVGGVPGLCPLGRAIEPNVNLPAPIAVLSVKEVWEKRARLDGQTVQVYGFYYQNPPTSALFPDQESFEKKDSSLCLWIGQNLPLSQAASVTRTNQKWVVIEGRLKSQSAGTFDQFFAQIEKVTLFEILPGKPK